MSYQVFPDGRVSDGACVKVGRDAISSWSRSEGVGTGEGKTSDSGRSERRVRRRRGFILLSPLFSQRW